MRYIKLRTFDNGIEANLALDKLQNNGIPGFITDENVTSLMPNLNFIHGGGIHLMVDRDNFEEADRVLRTDNTGALPD